MPLTMEKFQEYVRTSDVPLKKWIKIDMICKVVGNPLSSTQDLTEELLFYTCVLFRHNGEKKCYILWPDSVLVGYLKYHTPLTCRHWVDGFPRINILDDGLQHIVPEPYEVLVVGPQSEFGKLKYFKVDRPKPEYVHFLSAHEASIMKEMRDLRKKKV